MMEIIGLSTMSMFNSYVTRVRGFSVFNQKSNAWAMRKTLSVQPTNVGSKILNFCNVLVRYAILGCHVLKSCWIYTLRRGFVKLANFGNFRSTFSGWLVVWSIFYLSIQTGRSSSQLTNSYFSEGWLNHQSDLFFRWLVVWSNIV